MHTDRFFASMVSVDQERWDLVFGRDPRMTLDQQAEEWAWAKIEREKWIARPDLLFALKQQFLDELSDGS
jgi:hypothetical protein